MFFRNAILTTSLVALTAGPALAATTATATTDLNLRAGPGPQYEIIGVIAGDASADVEGCIEESNWCKVMYDGQEGWAYGEYLTASVEETMTPVVSEEVVVETITYDNSNDGEAFVSAGTVGAVAGALIAGPVGAAVGGMAAGTAGALAEPDTEVVTYVRSNTLDPIYLEGEVVTGAIVPDTVELVEIPESQYRYVYINGLPVLVEPEERTIVYVVR